MSEEQSAPGEPQAIRVMLVDDHDVVRAGLAALLARAPEFEIVGEAGSVREAIQAVDALAPNLVIMDVKMPDGSGIEACRDIRSEHPDTRVVMLTSFADDEAVLSAIIAGASGYLLKQSRSQELVANLRAVARGDSLLDPSITERVLERVRRTAASGEQDELSHLTPQERRILALVADGKTNKEIAAEIFLSDKTVKNYVSSILDKLGLERRTQAAAFVARRRMGD